jgi:uncharacterized membrane protein YhaH (DUF805 family)
MNNAVKLALNNYAVFRGRTTRRDYWLFWLFTFIVSIVAAKIDTVVSANNTYVQTLVELFLFIPSIATGTRRMHDVNRRGWWLLIPFANIFFLVQPSGPLNEFDL